MSLGNTKPSDESHCFTVFTVPNEVFFIKLNFNDTLIVLDSFTVVSYSSFTFWIGIAQANFQVFLP